MYEDWLPFGAVKQRTQMSERTIYRAISAGKLRQAHRTMPGRRPLPVFHPEDVAKLATTILPPEAESRQDPRQEPQQAPPMEFWAALIDALRARPAELPSAAETAEPALPLLAELRQKVIVTREEAGRLGFSPAILSRGRKAGKIERLPGDRYRLKELLEV